MLKLDVYKKKELQNFKTFLNQAEAEGITDIRFVREAIEKYIAKDLLENRKAKSKFRKAQPSQQPQYEHPVLKKCPSCGKVAMYERPTSGGFPVNFCSCGFSEMVKTTTKVIKG